MNKFVAEGGSFPGPERLRPMGTGRARAALGKGNRADKNKLESLGRIGRSRGSAIFSEQAWQEIGNSLQLSQRELEIVRGVFDDHTEGAIAADLGISSHTVHTHFERLHRKMRVADRVELMLRVTCEFLRLTTATGSVLPPICANRAAGRCPLLHQQAAA